MSSDRHGRAKQLLLEACTLAPRRRAAFLDEACGGDESLRREVEALLAFDEAASTDDKAPRTAPTPPLTSHSRPTSIGPYRLLQRIGEGGMGEVWEAEQERPVRRRVAVKLIKWGMDTKEVVARFESERQALALMSHANIARVHDAGATPEGRPYFVMEFVRGVPITRYCDTYRLTTAQPRRAVHLCLPRCAACPPQGRDPPGPQAVQHPGGDRG